MIQLIRSQSMPKHVLLKLKDTARCFKPGGFDRVKDKYDDSYANRMNDFAQSEKYEAELKLMLDGLGVDSDSKLLDLGCNTGQSMHRAHQWTGCSVWGVDQNRHGIEKGRELFPQYEFEWYEGQVLPYEDEMFDAVMINHVIGHVKEPVKFLSEVYRVLKPGGRAGIVTPNKRYKLCMLPANLLNTYNPDQTVLRYYTAKTLSGLTVDCGFRVRLCEYIGEYPGIFGLLKIDPLRFRVFAVAEKEQ